jgi:hypothetical protein
MADDALAPRFDDLCGALLAPLVLGGRVRLVRPFGAVLALRLGVDPSGEIRRVADADADFSSRISVARVRRARLLAPVDTLPDLDAGDFALLAALNDLLQVTNHHLAGPLTRGRYARIEANLRWLCERVPAPRDVLGALSRHATFARVLELARTDSAVSWWTGSARFRGETPPSRLVAWPEVRRVQVDARKIPLADMPVGAAALPADAYADVLSLFLTRTPLTDLATAARKSPPFAWSASTLALVAAGPGRMLALRTLAPQAESDVIPALTRAAAQVPPAYEEARRLAEGFAQAAGERYEKPEQEAATGWRAAGT